MFSSETKTPDFDLTITLSKSYQVFNSILRPIKNFSCSVKTMHTGSKYINSLMTTFYIPHSTLTFKITTNDFKHISVTDFTISVGTNSNAAGLQLLKRNGLPMSFSAMYHKAWDQSKFITALIRDIDSNNKPNKLSNNLLCMRYQKNLNENWKAAVTFQINNQLVSSMAVAWRAKIGKSVIHSSASTIGLVKTQFRRHITPNFDLVLTGSLDHISNSYNAGIGLSWFPSKENK
ncbi:hypothetical protein GPJ56_002088 [Histomonas meleagridis]|uniref:uncharacterized protein n=1 Tax=Histomonas meleagridis TaxID=135588 RepID=UPI0035598487|nr:hypothetical protein GPJ56_002088 [Histomonas meleagridis]KAH0803640.1 hypothetical protein GO595_003605 [Histomonas meleagridis]